MAEPISLLLVDDQELVRKGIRVLLEKEADLKVVGEAGDGEEAVDQYNELGPDVVLMDVQMPVVDGIAAIERIHGSDPQAKVIILTTFDDEEYIFEGMRAGAMGYVLKTISIDGLASAVRTVHLGGALLEPTIARKVFSTAEGRGRAGELRGRGRGRAGELRGRGRGRKRQSRLRGTPVGERRRTRGCRNR